MGRITWNDAFSRQKAQFIADVFKESLFDYAFDSNKVPSLNLHFFCRDYLTTYELAKSEVMKDGNMVPLIEEFEFILTKSPWLPSMITPSVMFFKGGDGKYKDISKDKNIDLAKKADYFCEIASFICCELEGKNNYLLLLLEKIKEILDATSFEIPEKDVLYYCVREFISELINIGLSKQHIYNQAQEKLFSDISVEDDKKYILDFLQGLTPHEDKYSVVFGVSDELFNEFNSFVKGIRKATPQENEKLGANYVTETMITAFDPVSALLDAKRYFGVVFSIYNSCLHNSETTIKANGLVEKENGKTYKFINDSTNLLKKNKNKKKEARNLWLKTAVSNGISSNMIGAFELHNNALSISDTSTQLLTLWTIFELLIETKQSFMNRVNYVSNTVSSVLCNIYYERRIEALFSQVTHTKPVLSIIKSETRGNSDLEKFALILKDNSSAISDIASKLSSYPLEKYKIEKYGLLFSDKEKMIEDLNRHSNRIRWQIMRIYRNRCMIVHDGSSMPYITGIVENLHYYIDETFEFLMFKMKNGITESMASFSAARNIEYEKLALLKDKTKLLSDDEFVQFIWKQ